MGARNPAEAVEVLDLLLKFFGDGERWIKGRLSDRRGNRCLVGALEFVNYGRSALAGELVFMPQCRHFERGALRDHPRT
jgi:hypothetical protein